MLFQFPIDICTVMLEYGTDLLKQRASDSRKYLKYIITQSSWVQIFSQQTLQRGFPKDDLSVSVRCMDQFVNLDTNMVLVLVPGYPLHSALKKGEKWNAEW